MMGEDDEFLCPMVRAVIQEFWKRRWLKRLGRKKENELKDASVIAAATTLALGNPGRQARA